MISILYILALKKLPFLFFMASPNVDDAFKKRFIQLTRRIAYLIFDVMEENETTSIRLFDFSELVRHQCLFDDETDANGWLTASHTNATRRQKQTGKMMVKMVGIVSTFLDAQFEVVYLSDVNDFVIRLRDWPFSCTDDSPTDEWSHCQAILFLNRIGLRLLDKKTSDELGAAIRGNSEGDIQCPFEGEDDE